MEGVRAVRLVSILAAISILSGIWMLNEPTDDAYEKNQATPFAELTDDSAEGAVQPESDADQPESGSENEDQSSDSNNLPRNLIFGGTGALGSLLIGSIMLEFVKVAVLVALVSPMLARMKSNSEDMLTRGRLLGYLEANAGIHFSALRDALGLANGVTSYHLNTLESSGQIISWRDGKLRRYAVSALSREEVGRIKNPIAGTRLAILEVLADSGSVGLSGPEIRKRMKISRQLLSHHLSELRNTEIVEAASERKRPNWRISDKGMKALVASREVSRKEAAA